MTELPIGKIRLEKIFPSHIGLLHSRLPRTHLKRPMNWLPSPPLPPPFRRCVNFSNAAGLLLRWCDIHELQIEIRSQPAFPSSGNLFLFQLIIIRRQIQVKLSPLAPGYFDFHHCRYKKFPAWLLRPGTAPKGWCKLWNRSCRPLTAWPIDFIFYRGLSMFLPPRPYRWISPAISTGSIPEAGDASKKSSFMNFFSSLYALSPGLSSVLRRWCFFTSTGRRSSIAFHLAIVEQQLIQVLLTSKALYSTMIKYSKKMKKSQPFGGKVIVFFDIF